MISSTPGEANVRNPQTGVLRIGLYGLLLCISRGVRVVCSKREDSGAEEE